MIGCIVINYRSEEKTIGFVRTELSKIRAEHSVVIVDNGSTAESLARLTEAFKDERNVVVTASAENLGFARGNNLGAGAARERFGADLLLFANNDISLLDSDAVDRMAAKLLSLDEAGAIGPKVIGPDGRLQSPEPFVSFWDRHISLYWRSLFRPKSRAFWEDWSQTAGEGFHYRVSGSFFMVRAADYLACGGMDQNTFLYAEEMILSERLGRIGKRVYYFPEVPVVHEHGATTRRYFDRVKVREMKYRSEKYYYRTYVGTPAWQFLVADLTYLLKRLLGR